jgi:SAM-dependent methyltransferase
VSDAEFRVLARAAAASYRGADRFARHFAYGKLTGDPVFEWILREGLVPHGTRVLDLGCGQGLLGALLFAAHVGDVRYEGIDLRNRDIERARAMAASLPPALASHATFRAGDIRYEPYPAADVVVMLDVMHYIDYRAQAGVFDRAIDALGPGGYLVLRVADATPSMRFRWTAFVDRLITRMRGQRQRKLYWRPLAGWREHLQRRRLKVTTVPMSSGTFFANVVLLARYDS